MAEPVWYYARGEVERGPFTSVQIKALANAGRLRRDDLVWKEGMESWTSAAEVAELFPASTVVTEESPKPDASSVSSPQEQPRPGPISAVPAIRREMTSLLVTIGRSCLFVGLSAAVLAKGCESLAERKVSRHDAAVKLRAIEQWQEQRAPLIGELESLQAKKRALPSEQDRIREITQTLKQLDNGFAAEELSADQRLALNRADAEFREGAFLRGLALHGGILFLLLGGFLLTLCATGTDRWLGIGILLLVCFATVGTK